MLRRLCLFVTAVPVALIIISSCILSPIYTQVAADVIYLNSPLPDILNYIIVICDAVMSAAQYTAVICSVLLLPPSSHRGAVHFIVVGTIVTSKVLNISVSAIIDGSIGSGDIWASAIYSALEITQYCCCALIAHSICRTAVKRYTLLRTASRRLGDNEFSLRRQLHFEHIYSNSNPIQSSGLILSIIFAALRMISRIIYDIGYGMPTSFSELLQMLLGYSSDILNGVIVYFSVMLFAAQFIKLLDKPKIKQQIKVI